MLTFEQERLTRILLFLFYVLLPILSTVKFKFRLIRIIVALDLELPLLLCYIIAQNL